MGGAEIRFVGAGEMRPEAFHLEPRRFRQYSGQRHGLGEGNAKPVHTGVHFQVHADGFSRSASSGTQCARQFGSFHRHD